MLRALDGAYVLRDRGDGTTEVTYRLALDVSIPLIGMLKRKGEKILIDTALKGLKKRVESPSVTRWLTVRILLFTGKGGVGKSTAAAGTAALGRVRGQRTLVLSHRRRALAGRRLRRDRSGAEPTEVAPTCCSCSRSTPSGGSSSPGARSRRYLLSCSTSPASTRSRPRS